MLSVKKADGRLVCYEQKQQTSAQYVSGVRPHVLEGRCLPTPMGPSGVLYIYPLCSNMLDHQQGKVLQWTVDNSHNSILTILGVVS